MDIGAWWATVYVVVKSWAQLSNFYFADYQVNLKKIFFLFLKVFLLNTDSLFSLFIASSFFFFNVLVLGP